MAILGGPRIVLLSFYEKLCCLFLFAKTVKLQEKMIVGSDDILGYKYALYTFFNLAAIRCAAMGSFFAGLSAMISAINA